MMSRNALIKRSGQEVSRTEPTAERPWFQPSVNIFETEEELTLRASMPGVRPADIDLSFENRTLTIHGKARSRQPHDTRFLVQEYAVGDYHRKFELSEQIDGDNITAEYHDGILTVHLPKVEAARPRKITVSSR